MLFNNKKKNYNLLHFLIFEILVILTKLQILNHPFHFKYVLLLFRIYYLFIKFILLLPLFKYVINYFLLKAFCFLIIKDVHFSQLFKFVPNI
jgi:hypothetical protein